LNGKSDDPSYGSHEQALKDQPPNTQNLCSKYTIPASERKKVLDRLYTMNINAHSLFGTDDTLMETLAYEAFLRRGWAW
jgi:hypothetical protein